MANPTSRYSTTYRVAYRFPHDGYRGELGDAIKRRSRSIYGVREGSQEGAGMITITATTPTGHTMHWSEHGWTRHAADAKDWKTSEAASQAATWDQPFRGIARLGWIVEVKK